MPTRARPFTTGVVAVTAAVLLAACGGGGAAAGSGGDAQNASITFWDNNAGPDRTPIYEEMIAKFETANPGIDVEYVGLPADSALQKYQTAIAGGSPPDVGVLSTSFLSSLIAQKALVPLDARLAGSPLAGQVDEIDLTSTRAAGGGKELFAMPMSINLATLWYRTDLFAAAGLKVPGTWDEFYAAAAALTDLPAQKYGFTLRGGAGSIFPLLQDMYAYSGVDTFFDAQGRSTVDDPRNVEAVEKLAGLYEKATPTADVNNGYPQMVAQFGGGSTAMMQHNLGSLTNHQKALPGKFAAAPLPVSLAGNHVLVPDAQTMYGVFTAGKQQDAAWKLVEFLMTAEQDSFWNQKVGQIPANTAARQDAWVKDTQSVQSAISTLSAPSTKIVTAPLYLPEFGKITGVEMPPLWQKVILGELPAREFLATFAASLTAAETKYRERR